MEELIKSMQALYKKADNEDDSEKYLHFCPRYSPPTKVANWFITKEALPKDNDPYHPPGGDYFLSTYRRLGVQEAAWETTTQAMLRQVCAVPPAVEVYKPMVDFTTTKLLEENLDDYKGLGSEDVDFVTTYNYDFRHPFPFAKTYSLKTEAKPQNFGMKKTPFNSHNDRCDTKYLDDDLYVAKCAPAQRR